MVPDRAQVDGDRGEIVVRTGDPQAPRVSREVVLAGVDALLDRSISLHRTPDAVYRDQSNRAEATYIAGLVREFLHRDTGLTLGIVAFSITQQTAIERALEDLAITDDLFATRYEKELNRTDGEQAIGLFVKNLENVQGDERDVVILSVCYGTGPGGQVLMNFGPINQAGGEKRLNVIVSRAREHLAVVSSLEAGAITNVTTAGALALQQFLAYAERVSAGQGHRGRTGPSPASAVVGQLAAGLRGRGIVVGEDVGELGFSCDLALRRAGDQEYRVAVLVDTPQRVARYPLVERLSSHPIALSQAGWEVEQVLTKDWLDDPERVLDRLSQRL
jgi:hypothetical protein